MKATEYSLIICIFAIVMQLNICVYICIFTVAGFKQGSFILLWNYQYIITKLIFNTIWSPEIYSCCLFLQLAINFYFFLQISENN